eukprot:TRINITY_DN14015_c0_g1_i1.p1 TRINITY_DN14015_c0_g1~~TRINITY_DN14015_c0_g1_i1.p1  ORF type:complete len:241 (-),score=17.76 TRINITY_DN14015_c0_g1_i1:376-1098(-)
MQEFVAWVQRLPHVAAKWLQTTSPPLAHAVSAVDIDSPIILVFAALCVFLYVFSGLLPSLACIPFNHFQFFNPAHYLRLFTHVAMHGSRDHLTGNMVNLLLVGPACERAFGSAVLAKFFLWTAGATGVAHLLFGKASTYAFGASGIVFMLILLNSLLSARTGRIPLTFIIQVILWCWQDIISQFRCSVADKCDGISHIAHLSGAFVGTALGFHFNLGTPPSTMQWFKQTAGGVYRTLAGK